MDYEVRTAYDVTRPTSSVLRRTRSLSSSTTFPAMLITHLLQQIDDHSTDVVDAIGEPNEGGCRNQPHVECEFEVILELVRRRVGVFEVPREVSSSLCCAFGDVRTDRVRGGNRLRT